jgi:hypothetical protein
MGAAGLDTVVLACIRPRFGALANGLRAPHAWLRADGTDHAVVALAGTAAWLAAVWLACGLLALAAAALPGAAGRVGQLISRRLLPRAARHLLAGSAGLGILVAPVAAGASAHAGLEHRSPARAATAIPSPSWPVDPPRPATVSAPNWPSVPAQSEPPQRRRTPADEIRVRTGDSLWLIAAHRLGPHASPAHIAHEWPRWYAANRAEIGPDAELIHPGQVLHAPDDRS